MYTGALQQGGAAAPANHATEMTGIEQISRSMRRQIDVPPSPSHMHDIHRQYVSDAPLFDSAAEPGTSQLNWVNRSTNSPFRAGTIPSRVTFSQPHVETNQASNAGAIQSPPQPKIINRVENEDNLLEDFMQFPPYANSTMIAKQTKDNVLKPAGGGNTQGNVTRLQSEYVRQSRKLNEDNVTVEASLVDNKHEETVIRDSSKQQLPSLRREQDSGSTDVQFSLVASADDRSILTELVHRTPPCLSDYFEHVFTFLLAIVPLFQLHLTHDFILMKYLLPKVSGQLSRIILSVAAIQGTFTELCTQIRLEFFCDRSISHLTSSKFFQCFQQPNQSISEYIDNMHAAYIFLKVPITQEQAVTIILENLLPNNLAALSGKVWPVTFSQLPQLIAASHRQAVISKQRNLQLSNPPVLNQDANMNSFQTSVQSSRSGHQSSSNLTKCFNCGDPNHFRNQCPRLSVRKSNLPSSPAEQTWKTDSLIRCFRCNQLGHIQRNCRQPQLSLAGNE